MVGQAKGRMTGNDRIRALRERTGKSCNEIASLAGLSFTEYFDLEVHDDELVTRGGESVEWVLRHAWSRPALATPLSSTVGMAGAICGPSRRGVERRDRREAEIRRGWD